MANFRKVYNSLLLVITGSTSKELARQIAYLKVENRILRSKLPARIKLTDKEKSRLCRFASKLGGALKSNTLMLSCRSSSRYCQELTGRQ